MLTRIKAGAVVTITAAVTSLAAGAMLSGPASAHHVASRCRAETVRQVTYSECETRTGNTVTYTYTQSQTVRV